MDNTHEFESPDVERSMRYRVMVTIVDHHAGQASVQMYDTNTVETALGPEERDPLTGLSVRNVTVRLPRSHLLFAEGEGHERS